MIYTANQFFRPFGIHLDLHRRFSILIRAGYIGRNPLHKFYYKVPDGALSEIKGKDSRFQRLRSTALGFYIVGVSGTGKSTSIEEDLRRFYPQVIRHFTFDGKPFNVFQIVWIKIDCPFDGSLSGLCVSFFQAIDELLGTNYKEIYAERGKPTLDKMLANMRRLVRLHGIGCLVIDEIQQLSIAKGQGITAMLNFFVNLVNRSGMPIVLIGTPKALPLLTQEFQQARRASGMGDLKWYPMQNDDEWVSFIKPLWKYQYVRKPVELTKELRDALFYASAGIVDFAIKAFILAQFRAIENKEETLTPGLLLSVADDSFSFAKDMLNMLRNHQYERLENIPDLQLFDLDVYYKNFLSRDSRNKFQEIIQEEDSIKQPINTEKCSARSSIPGPKKIRNTTKYQSKRNGLFSKASSEDNQSPDDLRSLYTKAIKKSTPPYEVLKKAGNIKDAAEFFG